MTQTFIPAKLSCGQFSLPFSSSSRWSFSLDGREENVERPSSSPPSLSIRLDLFYSPKQDTSSKQRSNWMKRKGGKNIHSSTGIVLPEIFFKTDKNIYTTCFETIGKNCIQYKFEWDSLPSIFSTFAPHQHRPSWPICLLCIELRILSKGVLLEFKEVMSNGFKFKVET